MGDSPSEVNEYLVNRTAVRVLVRGGAANVNFDRQLFGWVGAERCCYPINLRPQLTLTEAPRVHGARVAVPVRDRPRWLRSGRMRGAQAGFLIYDFRMRRTPSWT